MQCRVAWYGPFIDLGEALLLSWFEEHCHLYQRISCAKRVMNEESRLRWEVQTNFCLCSSPHHPQRGLTARPSFQKYASTVLTIRDLIQLQILVTPYDPLRLVGLLVIMGKEFLGVRARSRRQFWARTRAHGSDRRCDRDPQCIGP